VDNHFRKDWQRRVKTWFDQPARKIRRRNARAIKARNIFPRPVSGPLRPVVTAPSIKYNTKSRLGRGFTLEELKEAGVVRHLALSIGIAVDHRRRNHCEKSLRLNVQRLKEYKSKLILFPRNATKGPKKGDATAEEISKAVQQTTPVLPIKKISPQLQSMAIKDIDKNTSAYTTLKVARTDARMVGIRAVRKKAKADNAALAAAKKSTD